MPGYDNTSRRTFIDAQVGNEAVKRTLFNYDDVGQLQSEVEGPGADLNRTYAYDAMGNRQSQTRNEPGTTNAAAINTSFTRNPLNQITASTSTFSNAATPTSSLLNYDASGNLTRVLGMSGTGTAATPTGATEYAYNDDDRLEEVTNKDSSGTITGKSVMVYDGLGRKRISREFTYNAATDVYTKTEEIRRIYDGMDVVQERDDQNVVKTNYVRAGNIGGLLSKSKREAGQQDVHLYYHYDGQGNVVQMTNATQSTVADYRYDAWGNSRLATGSEAAGNRYRFSTKELCSGGLYDYGLRFYNPSLGRFINRDPSGEAGGLNLYLALSNDPLSNVDAYGLSPKTALEGFAVGLGVSLLVALGIGAMIAATGAAAGALAPVIAAVGAIAGAVAVAQVLKQAWDIEHSDLCPDVKDYYLGMLAGGFLGTILGGYGGNKFGNKFRPKTPTPLDPPSGTPRPSNPSQEGDPWHPDAVNARIIRGRFERRTVNDELPKDPKTGQPIPDPRAVGDHTVLGTRTSPKQTAEPYRNAATFDANGNPVGKTEFTNHYPMRGWEQHPNPHYHPWSGATYERGPHPMP